jgi:Domain of unknown function (DUF4823)
MVRFFKPALSLLLFGTLLTACGTSVQSSGGVVTGKTLLPSAKVLIIPFADAIDKGGKTIGGSGGAVTGAMRDNLLAHGASPATADSKTLADGLIEAQKLGYNYVLKGSLINWEDNATEWSGRPDTAGITIEVYDTNFRELLGSATENVRASMVSYTAGSPDRFAPALADLALSKTFGWRPAASSLNPK